MNNVAAKNQGFAAVEIIDARVATFAAAIVAEEWFMAEAPSPRART